MTPEEMIRLGGPLLGRINAVRAAQDYAIMSGYARVHEVDAGGPACEFHDEGTFWRAVLDKRPVAPPPRAVTLRGFRLSRWVPRVPGLYWKRDSRHLRLSAGQYMLPVEVVEGEAGDSRHQPPLYSPSGKTLRLLGGVGNVRLLPTASGCLLVASSSGGYWRGVPVLVATDLWRRLGEVEEGTVADVRGVWTPMPRDVAQGLGGEAGIPRNCLLVTERRDFQAKAERLPGRGSAWTLFERRDGGTALPQLDFAYCVFSVEGAARSLDPSALEEHTAGEWLTEYIGRYSGRALTDYDEVEPRLDPLLPINEVMSREVEPRRLRDFVDGVKRRAFSPDAVKYDALPEVLTMNFDAEELTYLALAYLGIELENVAGRNAPRPQQALALFEFAREQMRLEDLVVGVLCERPALSAELAAQGLRWPG
jgi:hypothetical protein